MLKRCLMAENQRWRKRSTILRSTLYDAITSKKVYWMRWRVSELCGKNGFNDAIGIEMLCGSLVWMPQRSSVGCISLAQMDRLGMPVNSCGVSHKHGAPNINNSDFEYYYLWYDELYLLWLIMLWKTHSTGGPIDANSPGNQKLVKAIITNNCVLHRTVTKCWAARI